MRSSYGICAGLGVAAAALIVASPARAQETATGDTLRLSLEDAQRRAIEYNPTLLAETEEIAIGRGALRQARLLINPEAEVEAPSSLRGEGIDRYEARLSQEIEWAGQRGLRIDAAELGVRTAELVVDQASRELLAAVSRAYYSALAARRRRDLAVELLGLNERLGQAVAIQLDEGEISEMDANLARIEVGRARARLLTARREARSAEIELLRLVGLEPGSALELVGELPPVPAPDSLDPDSLIAVALESRADLAARRVILEQARVRTRLARREAIPNVRVGALAEREGDGGTRFGVSVGLPLPLWNRNQGITAQRDAEARQAALRLEAAELRVRADVLDAWRRFVSASEEALLLEEQVLGPAHENQEMLSIAYEAGRIDLPSLVLLRNQLLEAELDYWRAWLAAREALVDLESATGVPRLDDMNEGNR